MATAHVPVSDMLATVKSRELQRGMLAEMRADRSGATRHLLAAGHLELVLADDCEQADRSELAFSRLSAASCFWRAGQSDQEHKLFEAMLQEHPTREQAIREAIADLEHDYPEPSSSA